MIEENKLRVLNFFRVFDESDQVLMSCRVIKGSVRKGLRLMFDKDNVVEILDIDVVSESSIVLLISRKNEKGLIPNFSSFKESVAIIISQNVKS